MQIKVKLFASFRDGRFKEELREYEEGTTPGDIIAALGIDLEEVGVIMVNSRHADADRPLSEKDNLAIFPVIGGG